jgi:hypothetical protein
MRNLIETADSISAKIVAKVLAADRDVGVVELEIEGAGTQQVEMVSTPGNFGGRLRWFVCPGCGRRAGKLYLPKGETIFLCRLCHRLEYRQQALREFRNVPDGQKDWTRPEKRQGDRKKMLEWMTAILRARREKR